MKQNTGRVAFVPYEEPLSIKIGAWLVKKGFVLASEYGVAAKSTFESSYIGVLLPKDPKDKWSSICSFLRWFVEEDRRVFLGIFHLQLQDCENIMFKKDNEKIIFKMYGAEYSEVVRQLVNEMISVFNVDVIVECVSGNRFETYARDTDV